MGFPLKYKLSKEDYEAAFNLLEFNGISVSATDLLNNEAIRYFNGCPKHPGGFNLPRNIIFGQWKDFYLKVIANLRYNSPHLPDRIKIEMREICVGNLIVIHKKCFDIDLDYESI